MCYEAAMRLPCLAVSVQAARSFVAGQLVAWGAGASDSAHVRVDDIKLVTSELVGNAAKFCASEIEVSVSSHRDHVEVAVSDDNPASAVLQHPGPDIASGRGLLLVDALAERWGQRPHGGGKTLWARLALPPGSALARGCRLPLQ